MTVVQIVLAIAAIWVTLMIAIVGGAWHLSTKIGDVRLEISGVRAEAVKNDGKTDAMWSWWTDRPCETAHRPEWTATPVSRS